MKTSLFTLFFISFLISNAQVYVHFPDSNTSWKTTTNIGAYPGGQIYHSQHIETCISTVGKTTLNSYEYTIMERTHYSIFRDMTTQEQYGPGTVSKDSLFLREENQKVYAYNPNTTYEGMLYDFTLNVGDTFPFYDEQNFEIGNTVVLDIDSIQIGNTYHKRFKMQHPGGGLCFSENDFNSDLYFIEGIGSNIGLFYSKTIAGLNGCNISLDCFATMDTSFAIDGSGNYDASSTTCVENLSIDEVNSSVYAFFDAQNRQIIIHTQELPQNTSYTIFNVLGQSVQSGITQPSIHVSELHPGTYMFKSSGHKNSIQFKFVVQ